MTEEVSTSRGARSRRTMAILAWAGLAIVAAVLWSCRRQGLIRSHSSEPVALMLSAYAAFVSIFAWMLFSPGRRALKESPALFFSAAITLLPPCVIAFHLMPPDSALRGWLTLGMFCFGAIAVLSPVPEEFFAIPRERRSYLRPVTGALFEGLSYQADQARFQQVDARVPVKRTSPSVESYEAVSTGDPWGDSFAGTGTLPRRPRPPENPASFNRRAPPPAIIPVATPVRTRQSPVSSEIPGSPDALPNVAPDVASRTAKEVALTFERMKDDFGGELVEGTIRVRFEPGQKRAHLHVPFQPPLPGVPDVECEAVGAETFRVKVPVRQTYGIRIEARRSDATDALESEVGFSAIYTPPERRI